MLHFTNNGSVTNSGPPVHYRQVRYRLLPGTTSKARQLFGLAGAGRFIWNHFLAKHQAAYQLHKKNPEQQTAPSVSFFPLAKEFPELRNSGELPWLQGYSFKIVRAALQSLSLAFQGVFRGKGHPRFKAKGRDKPRFTIPDKVKIKGDHIRIPGVGLLRLRRHNGNPYPEGRPVKDSVVHECGKWYATVCY
ncbi:MAG: transposase, partial [Cyanobacteria bacterium MAG IRC4_bin_6]|nr:transposase [Cyanobacteria bacterium MAG IRC4_bin_6]